MYDFKDHPKHFIDQRASRMSEVKLDFQTGKGRHNAKSCHRTGAKRQRESLEDEEKIMTETKVKFEAQGQKQRHEKLTRKGQRNWMHISRHSQSRLDRSPANLLWASLPQRPRMPPSLASWSDRFPA